MRAWRIHYDGVLVCVVLVAGVLLDGTVHAQSKAEVKELKQRVIELHHAGKYADAIPFAERYAEAMKVGHDFLPCVRFLSF
jgi:hypothetical protein